MRTCAFLIKRMSFIFVFFTLFSFKGAAQQQDQTLILAGSAVNSCSEKTALGCSAQNKAVFRVSKANIKQIRLNWPSSHTTKKADVLTTLDALISKNANVVSKSELLWQWRDINNEQLNSLTKQEFNFVFDMLEQPHANTTPKAEPPSNGILQFIAGSLKVANPTPTLLIISAAQRDPYAQVEALKTLLPKGVTSQWLPLTPALAKAITNNTCSDLPALRHSQMNLYNRSNVYPELTKAEHTLCNKGVEALVNLINTSTGVLFSDGTAKNALKALYDENNIAYPWTNAIKTRPVIVGLGAGSKIQSENVYLSQHQSETVLKAKSAPQPTVIKGLNTFTYGSLSTRFSEQNQTLNLASTLNNVKQNAVIKHGFGIDENTALVVIKSQKGNLMTVIGQSGVVHLSTQQKANNYNYSYWPARSVIDITNAGFKLSERTISQALAPVKIPPLPVQRFANILTDSKLRSLTQAMCLSQEQSAVGQQDDLLINLTATKNTHYYRVNTQPYGCALSNLLLNVERF
ncbi:cyanophycinase [Pseudoalteromonas sp. S3785]|uniref:cyanophycinase n=1 Tax=Pseudoalteromonas sp. S3785 TaxID=579545 RepID=UPI00110C17B7|nr:cyanophycinase [Pseudoalteromonas sp. S3785]TMO72733.1 cyanophycinase [Pseudoalteromonas sp. S3785]